MYCSNCGKKVNDNARFCEKCGNPINEKTSKKNSNFKWGYVIIGLMFLLCVIILILIMKKDSMKNETDIIDKSNDILDETEKLISEDENSDRNTENEVLFPIEDKGMFGFVNKYGETIIPTQYDCVSEFSEGLAAVCMDGKWGFINTEGELVIDFLYDNPWPVQFSEGLVTVCVDGNWGYINMLGETVVDCQYDDASSFSEGQAIVRLGLEEAIINTDGEIIYSSEEINLGHKYSEGLIPIENIVERDEYGMGFYACGYMDKVGKIIIEPYYAGASGFSNGLAAVEVDGKWGYINENGEVVLDFQYDVAFDFSEGVAIVEKDGKSFLIDAYGNTVLENDEFSFIVYDTPNENGTATNKMINGMLYAYDSANHDICYVINKKGEILLKVDGTNFVGLAKTENDDGVFVAKTVVDGWYEAEAYIDKKDKVIWNFVD